MWHFGIICLAMVSACRGEAWQKGRLGVQTVGIGGDIEAMRAAAIKTEVAANGGSNALLYAGIAYHESAFAQCHSEATWACEGPYSDDCGGPVLAGSADGPCSDEQGGLGMFQFDAGTYDQTLDARGSEILSISGNVATGVDFIVGKVRACPNVDDFESDSDAVAWIDSATVGSEAYDLFLDAMTWCYAGCNPSWGCYPTYRAGYEESIEQLRTRYGDSYWEGGAAYTDDWDPGSGVPAGCEGMDALGRCVSETILERCDAGTISEVDCGGEGMVCRWQGGATGAACVSAPFVEGAPGSGCQGVSAAGDCYAGVLGICENGSLELRDCAELGLGCSWSVDAMHFDCRPGCGDLDWIGACVGSSLRWCEGGTVQAADCGPLGLTCRWASGEVGYNCL